MSINPYPAKVENMVCF